MDSASGRLSAALLLLYYIQGNYAAIYDKPLFDAPFVPLKESALPLTLEAKEVIDRVLDTFGMYSGKVLESITHKETPWMDARKGFLPDETSHAEISLDAMKEYFKKVDKKYNIQTEGKRLLRWGCKRISVRKSMIVAAHHR